MQLMSLFIHLALLLPAFAASHDRSTDHSIRLRKARLHGDNQSSAANTLERRASGPDVRYSYYYPEQSGNPTACGEMHHSEEAIVAVPIQQFKNSWCNRGISIKYKGATVSARIVDACVGCPYNSLDLTPSLFRALDGGSLGAGYLWGGSWNFHGEGDEEDDKPTTTSKKPEPTTTKKPDPETTSSSSKTSSRRTSSSTTSSEWESSSSSSSRRSSTWSSSQTSSESSTAASSSSSSSQHPSATPLPTARPGSIGSLESALGGFAQFLVVGAQQA